MSGEVFVDSNVLIYALGDDDGKRQVADRLIASRPVISSQVLSETANVLRRKFSLDYAAIGQVLAVVASRASVIPVTAEVVFGALRLGERYGYGFYDCQILAAAQLSGCKIVFSEDLHHGQKIEGLTIVNPFAPD